MEFQSPYHLFSLLEMYNFKTGSFFIPIGELGLTLHEIFKVLALSMGDVLYEEYIPTTEELNMLKAKNVHIYKIY